MSPADSICVLQQLGIVATCLADGWWNIKIPWATGTPLEVAGEVVSSELVCGLADALLTAYPTPTQQQHLRADVQAMLEDLIVEA